MASTASVILLTNGSATSSGKQWPGGTGIFAVAGTFGGATIKLQMLLPDGATWFSVGTDTELTASGAAGFTLAPCLIRAEVTGGPPSGIYADAARVPV